MLTLYNPFVRAKSPVLSTDPKEILIIPLIVFLTVFFHVGLPIRKDCGWGQNLQEKR